MAENIFLTRSLGTPCEGIRDQYADGKAARVWETFIGSIDSRTQNYNEFLVGLLRKKGCKRILDVACGTGVDSIMLLEEGFQVTSIDASDKMLKYALKKRWKRRNEEAFDKWVIEEANWLTLSEDIGCVLNGGFDAVICLGNSFAHLMDPTGDQSDQKQALKHFELCVKPGGLLLIDHRNFDVIVDTGCTPARCIYYNSPFTTDIETSILYVRGKPAIVTMDYFIDVSVQETNKKDQVDANDFRKTEIDSGASGRSEFRLSYYPHKLKHFTDMLDDIFPLGTRHTIFGDFKPLEEIETPGFYIHVMEKPRG